jgi:hypothetical protein
MNMNIFKSTLTDTQLIAMCKTYVSMTERMYGQIPEPIRTEFFRSTFAYYQQLIRAKVPAVEIESSMFSRFTLDRHYDGEFIPGSRTFSTRKAA